MPMYSEAMRIPAAKSNELARHWSEIGRLRSKAGVSAASYWWPIEPIS
jgi:hypothetical protein